MKVQIRRQICSEMKHGPIMRLKASLDAFNYWNRIRGGEDAPLRSDVDPAAIRHILPQIFILEMASDEALRFRLAGTLICSLFGKELRGAIFASLWGEVHSEVAETTAGQVMSNLAPMLVGATGHTASGRKVGIEIILLPMRSATGRCDRLLGCLTPATTGAWIGNDVLVGLTFDRSVPLSAKSKARTPQATDRRTSASSWKKSAAGLEGAARWALHMLAGGDRSVR